MQRFHISGIPITKNGRLVGILTNRDIRFENAWRDDSRADDERAADHRTSGNHIGAGEREPAPYKIEKLPVETSIICSRV